ncbi:hypothetical protein FQA39_LY04070 [Lamprigera yunnana]|nr:hypothetical protein FQA39_LY04070 [Lamprigera yunnana]
MRDSFGLNFTSKEENKETSANEDEKFKRIHISSNGYYGYQLVQSNNEKAGDDEVYEFMDVQCADDSDIQFNNFISPEDRLCDQPVGITVTRESANRKRRLNCDVDANCKKRRELEERNSELLPTYKYLSTRQPTHNVPDVPRNLMGHFI